MHENHRAVVLIDEDVVFTVETESFLLRGQYTRRGIRDCGLSGVVGNRFLVASDAGQSFKACPRSHLVRRRATMGFGLQTKLTIRRAFGRLGAKRPYIRWDSQPNPDTSLQ